ncbi:MAG: alpha/beta hydrolase [Gammaproteobacteria bacterium]
MREDITFDADGTTLRGWFYPPREFPAPYPTVIMAHGFSALKEMGLNRYAEIFSAAGLACIVYDNRNLGASDGEPRDEIDPIAQMRDYRHAVSYACTRSDVAADRIGIWGTSYTGGLVLIAAATDRRVRCVVSQVPAIHGYESARLAYAEATLAERFALIDEERKRLFSGAAPRTVSVVDYDPTQPPSSPNNRTYTFFHAYDDTEAFSWSNRITIRSLDYRFEYDALAYAGRVSPTPLLMIVASDDVITPTELALEAFARAGEPKRLATIEGDHYRPYLEAFELSSALARDWFVMHLGTD